MDEALRTIQTYGVEHLTPRTVGERLGVPRSALYRHFADKQSLPATVGKEGFRKLRETIADAWEQNGRGRAGLQAMGKAYVQSAVAHPSHYRVMFGRFIESAAKDDQFVAEANAAFQVLVDALVEQQNAGDVRRDDPVLMACFVWAFRIAGQPDHLVVSCPNVRYVDPAGRPAAWRLPVKPAGMQKAAC